MPRVPVRASVAIWARTGRSGADATASSSRLMAMLTVASMMTSTSARSDSAGVKMVDGDFDRIADRAQARGEGLNLGATNVCLYEVLSDKESAGDTARVAQDDLRCAGADDELGHPGAEPAAAPDVYLLAAEGRDRSGGVAPSGDLCPFVGHRPPLQWGVGIEAARGRCRSWRSSS